MNQFVVLSGCSGGGKSSVLAELARRGYTVVEEPGRRIVRQEMEHNGSALPWMDMTAFLRRAMELSLADRQAMQHHPGWIFFDRGWIDAAAARQRILGEPIPALLAEQHRYHRRVFLTPPWPEIYVSDSERKHGFEEAVVEYNHLLETYPALGYEGIVLPQASVSARAELILSTLGLPQLQNLPSV
ncbi:AAA family ATPase [Terriglobus tenax]|uniref:AAA family ATPase n=1 Tax=Terriglobus tenax TaxID=1111115 RepID=UPI0021E05A34|nr:AAA family ATPase [Terriglobus tenax]